MADVPGLILGPLRVLIYNSTSPTHDPGTRVLLRRHGPHEERSPT